MADRKEDQVEKERPRQWLGEVSEKEERRLKARREKNRSIWFGLGMMGLVGWTVAIPTVIGIGIGLWLDSKFPGRISWTLTGMFIGLSIGCYTAWRWVERESHHE